MYAKEIDIIHLDTIEIQFVFIALLIITSSLSNLQYD